MTTGLVFNLQKYSVHDGPGIRTTVFLKGCPLQCWWCHNPESQAVRPEVALVETHCIGCDVCEAVCPNHAPVFGPLDTGNSMALCTRCGKCVEVCPTGARTMVGVERSVDDLMNDILKDRIFYDDSNGGVTFSGGEPLLQPEFLSAMLHACRKEGIHTAVDTSGFAPRETLFAMAPLTNLFLYDLKLMDDDRHILYTGVSNRLIIENLRALSEVHPNIWIRVPIIPGLNDSTEQLDAIAEFASVLPGVRQVNLLPYHAIGRHKFERMNKPYRLGSIVTPTPDRMAEVAERFRERGLTTHVGG